MMIVLLRRNPRIITQSSAGLVLRAVFSALIRRNGSYTLFGGHLADPALQVVMAERIIATFFPFLATRSVTYRPRTGSTPHTINDSANKYRGQPFTFAQFLNCPILPRTTPALIIRVHGSPTAEDTNGEFGDA